MTMPNYFITNLSITKIANHYLKIQLSQVEFTCHGDDLYLALTAVLIGGQAESIPVLASTTTQICDFKGQTLENSVAEERIKS